MSDSRADAFNRWLRAVPTVNAKMLVAYSLAVLIVITLCVCWLVGAAIDDGVLGIVCGFVTALAGVGHLDYKAQRATWKTEPPPDESPATPPEAP
jgi:hypothetical protein